jgi:hypothetical protein
MKSVSLVLQSALLATGLFACSGDGVNGPCYVDYQSPIFSVRKVANATSGASVPQIRLSNFTLTRNGAVLTQDIRTQISGPHYGVFFAGDDSPDLVCDVSCGFGTEPGHYSMTVTAAGFAPKQVQYDVDFTSKRGGGCPLILSGPTTVDISLVPGA